MPPSHKGPESRSPAWRRDREDRKRRRPATRLDDGSIPGIIDNMDHATSPMSDSLRRAIVESGTSFLRIEKDTGVQRACISRFVAGKRSLRLDIADRLAAYLGLELRPRKKGR